MQVLEQWGKPSEAHLKCRLVEFQNITDNYYAESNYSSTTVRCWG